MYGKDELFNCLYSVFLVAQSPAILNAYPSSKMGTRKRPRRWGRPAFVRAPDQSTGRERYFSAIWALVKVRFAERCARLACARPNWTSAAVKPAFWPRAALACQVVAS